MDGYAGYREIGRRNNVALALWWRHVRRKFFELAKISPPPRITETLALIKTLYAIDLGQGPDARRAVRYAAMSRNGLPLFLEDGRAEPTVRLIALNRKNALFAGSEDAGDNWAIIASFIETAKLDQVDPLALMPSTLGRLVRGHSSHELD